jgi:hypothetical protein
MAVLGRRLAAQQGGRLHEVCDRENCLDLAVLHELEKLRFVGRPVSFALLVIIEQLLGRSQKRLVLVRGADQLVQKEREILRLGEPGELG